MSIRHGICALTSGLVSVMLSGGVTAAQQPPKKPDTGVVAALVVTGCLERWATDTTAGSDPGGKPPDGVQFMLTHAEGVSASATSPAPTVQPAPSPNRYLLLDSKTINYGAHLNHRVRIAGAIAPQPSAGASVAQQIADPATRETNLPATAETVSYSGSLVDVSTLTMVAPSCGK